MGHWLPACLGEACRQHGSKALPKIRAPHSSLTTTPRPARPAPVLQPVPRRPRHGAPGLLPHPQQGAQDDHACWRPVVSKRGTAGRLAGLHAGLGWLAPRQACELLRCGGRRRAQGGSCFCLTLLLPLRGPGPPPPPLPPPPQVPARLRPQRLCPEPRHAHRRPHLPRLWHRLRQPGGAPVPVRDGARAVPRRHEHHASCTACEVDCTACEAEGAAAEAAVQQPCTASALFSVCTAAWRAQLRALLRPLCRWHQPLSSFCSHPPAPWPLACCSCRFQLATTIGILVAQLVNYGVQDLE